MIVVKSIATILSKLGPSACEGIAVVRVDLRRSVARCAAVTAPRCDNRKTLPSRPMATAKAGVATYWLAWVTNDCSTASYNAQPTRRTWFFPRLQKALNVVGVAFGFQSPDHLATGMSIQHPRCVDRRAIFHVERSLFLIGHHGVLVCTHPPRCFSDTAEELRRLAVGHLLSVTLHRNRKVDGRQKNFSPKGNFSTNQCRRRPCHLENVLLEPLCDSTDTSTTYSSDCHCRITYTCLASKQSILIGPSAAGCQVVFD